MTLLTLLACGGAPILPPVPPAAAATEEIWSGAVALPGTELGFTATLTPGAEGWSGRIDIPLQNVSGMALQAVSSSAEQVSFTLQPPGAPEQARAVFSGARTGAAVTGSLQQAGQEFPLTMRKVSAEEGPTGPSRPQTPQPPFAYQVEEVAYPSGDITIAGTLTVPSAAGPHPAALLLTGSGAQDRDETIFAHKPFAVIADRLTQAGYAVLRVDDRGVGGTGGSTPDATAALLVQDAAAGVAFLRARDDIGAVGLIGHSEGGMIGPMLAAQDDGIAFVIMLAGPGISSRDILLAQGRTGYEAAGATGPVLEDLLVLHAAALDAVGAEPDVIAAAVRALLEAQLALVGQAMREEQLAAHLAVFQSPWFESFVGIDPADYLPAVQAPVLAVIGELDFQVPPSSNLPALQAHFAAHPDATVEQLASLNHLLQTAQTGLLDEYAVIEETIAPAALERVVDWLEERIPQAAQ